MFIAGTFSIKITETITDIYNRIFRSTGKLQSEINYRVPIENDISQTIHHKDPQRQLLQHVPATQRKYIYLATVIGTIGVVTTQGLYDLRLVERALN